MRKASQIQLIFLILIALITSDVIASNSGNVQDSSWQFNGIVTSETGVDYGYLFYVSKQGRNLGVKTAIIDLKTNKTLIAYQKETILKKDSQDIHWRIGDAFMHYNAISSSWVMGLNHQKDGDFNFRIDMLHQNDLEERVQLRDGLDLVARQSQRVNGHIHITGIEKEQFVSANTSWFGYLEASNSQKIQHPVTITFCRLKDNQGFFLASMPETDAKSSSTASWQNAEGSFVTMSQFAQATYANSILTINISTPKLTLLVPNSLNGLLGSRWVAGESTVSQAAFCVQSTG